MNVPATARAAATEAIVDVAASHPAFAGHFPGQPLLPAVSLLAEVIETVRAGARNPEALSVAAAKFLAPVRPGDRLTIALAWPADDSGRAARREVRFEVKRGETLCASGAIAVALAELPAGSAGAAAVMTELPT